MFLNYLALAMTLFGLLAIFYGFIYIHELPYEAAKHRNHPQQDAIYVACWLSLFTLHAIWPLVFLWALTHKEPAGAGTAGAKPENRDLSDRLSALESRLALLEKQPTMPSKGSK